MTKFCTVNLQESLLEEQKSTLGQLHRERQALEEEKVQFNMKQKMTKEESSQYSIKAAQAKAEFEALTRAIAEAKDRYMKHSAELNPIALRKAKTL